MAKLITQETFNAAVIETMELLSLTEEDALSETIKQFESQGINLTNIIKTTNVILGENPVEVLVEKLKDSSSKGNILPCLDELKSLLAQDIAYQMLAGKMGVYDILIDMIDQELGETAITQIINTLSSLMNGYPDLLEDKGIRHMMRILTTSNSNDVVVAVLQWLRICCINHEKNRQILMKNDITNCIKYILDGSSSVCIKSACKVITALTYDDDIRVQISDSHKNACTLAEALLEKLLKLLRVFDCDEEILCEIFLAIATLLVRKEYCEVMAKGEGLKAILDILCLYAYNERLHMKILQVLGNMAGNDSVKAKIIDCGAAPLIVGSMVINSNSCDFNIYAFNCIARLCLRNPRNCHELHENGVLDLILAAMKKYHSKNNRIIKSGCRAMRNLISHNPEIKQDLYNPTNEEFLRQLLDEKEDYYDDVKELLKEMGCDVTLLELWTGQGKQLEQ